ESAARGPLAAESIEGPEVTRIASGRPEHVDGLFPGADLSAVQAETIWTICRLVMARSALHAALVLSAIARRTDFGLGGPDGRPDLLGMEGSVWKSPGYPELVRRYWQALEGDRALRVDFAAEKSFDASSAGPLYLTALHEQGG
ncbi:MAG: hypothetical protein JXA90_13335, partial [Planctomycetes bacterium]|nr:hypothetical protein [Planctomycetota bacterium]